MKTDSGADAVLNPEQVASLMPFKHLAPPSDEDQLLTAALVKAAQDVPELREALIHLEASVLAVRDWLAQSQEQWQRFDIPLRRRLFEARFFATAAAWQSSQALQPISLAREALYAPAAKN